MKPVSVKSELRGIPQNGPKLLWQTLGHVTWHAFKLQSSIRLLLHKNFTAVKLPIMKFWLFWTSGAFWSLNACQVTWPHLCQSSFGPFWGIHRTCILFVLSIYPITLSYAISCSINWWIVIGQILSDRQVCRFEFLVGDELYLNAFGLEVDKNFCFRSDCSRNKLSFITLGDELVLILVQSWKSRQYWVSLIMYKLEVVVLKRPVFLLVRDSRIMVMNWLWIWIWVKIVRPDCQTLKNLSWVVVYFTSVFHTTT